MEYSWAFGPSTGVMPITSVSGVGAAVGSSVAAVDAGSAVGGSWRESTERR